MALWWIGNTIFIFVIIPVVVVLLQRLVRSVLDVAKQIDITIRPGVSSSQSTM
jgi:uncharacterized membrane protein